MKVKHHFSHPLQCTSSAFDRFLQQNNGWYTEGFFSTSNLRKLSRFLPTEMLAAHILKCYPYYASTVTNHTHGLQKQNEITTTQVFFPHLNIFSVFFWRKPDVFRLWERKFSWYLFPQQCLAAFGNQVPIVQLLVLQSTEAAEAMLSDWLEETRCCVFEGATAGTRSSP